MKLLTSGKKKEIVKSVPDRCLNCGERIYYFDFCSYCGQKTNTDRISIRNLIHDAYTKTVGLDFKFLRTFFAISIRPGETLLSYVSGERKKFTNPVNYYLFAISYAIIIVMVTNFYLTGSFSPTTTDVGDRTYIFDLSGEAKLYLLIFATVIVLILGLVLKILFFRNKRNIAESLSLALYLSSHVVLTHAILFNFAEICFYYLDSMPSLTNNDMMAQIHWYLVTIAPISFVYGIPAIKKFYSVSYGNSIFKIFWILPPFWFFTHMFMFLGLTDFHSAIKSYAATAGLLSEEWEKFFGSILQNALNAYSLLFIAWFFLISFASIAVFTVKKIYRIFRRN